MLLFLVTPCLAVAVEPYIKWIPINKKCFLCWESFWDISGLSLGYAQTPCLENGSNFSHRVLCNSFPYYSDGNCTKKIFSYLSFWWKLFWEFFGQYWISFLYLLRFVCFLWNFRTYFINNSNFARNLLIKADLLMWLEILSYPYNDCRLKIRTARIMAR